MRRSGVRSGRWLLAGLGGTIIVILLVSLFKAPEASLSQGVAHPLVLTKVELAGDGDTLLNEEAGLRDPTPLFIPTRWNAGEEALAMNVPRELGGSFQDYAPQWAFDPAQLKLELPPAVDAPLRPADGFATDKSDRTFAGFGQTDGTVTPLPLRGGFIEVAAEDDGRVVLRQPLLEGKPPGEGTWQPLEFLVVVDSAGIVRPPVLTESSRVLTVDTYFQDYLVKSLRIGDRLAPGFYRISIGP
jgi:hypothetical protein